MRRWAELMLHRSNPLFCDTFEAVCCAALGPLAPKLFESHRLPRFLPEALAKEVSACRPKPPDLAVLLASGVAARNPSVETAAVAAVRILRPMTQRPSPVAVVAMLRRGCYTGCPSNPILIRLIPA